MCGGPDPKKEARKAEKRAREQARRHAEAMRKQDEQNQKMIANMEKQAAANVRRQELATSNMMKKNEKGQTVQTSKPKKRASATKLRIPLANTGVAGGGSGQNTP